MRSTQFAFGCLQDGRAVTAYRLQNAAGTSVTVLDYGAIVQSLSVPDRQGRLTDVVLGYDTPAEYARDDAHLGATIGRVGNRIGGAAFTLHGKRYPLAANAGGNHLHGGLRGFDRHFWTAEPSAEALVFTRLSPDGEEGYPGALQVRVTFRLTEDNALAIQYDAVCDQDTPVNLTNHSYFNLNGGGNILGHQLQLSASRYTEVDAQLIPTGRLLEVAGTPFDFRAPKAIGADIGADHPQLALGRGYDLNFVLGGGPAAVLWSPDSGIQLTVTTDLPGVQVYTSNSLTDRAGKGGRAIGLHSAICLETQLFPDGMAHYGFPSPVLHQGEALHTETRFAFSVR